MRPRRTRATSVETLGLLAWMAVFTGVPGSAAPRDEAPTALGTIVGVRPDTGTILLDVGFSDVQADLLRFQSTDSTRIRVNGGFGRLADVHTGQTARITYVRADGAYIAELIEVTEVPPAFSVPTEAAREASGIESRKRYLEDAARTLDVLEESIGELRQYPDIEGTDELERLNKTVEELEIKLADARALHSSLSATASQKAWRRGVDLLGAAIEDLTTTYERRRSDVTNR